MSATLRLIRQAVGIELRRGTFEVTLDGREIGTIEWNGTFEAPVGPGPHTLRVKAGRYSSPSRTFDAADGAVVEFRCHGAMMWPRYVASIAKPDLALSLRRE